MRKTNIKNINLFYSLFVKFLITYNVYVLYLINFNVQILCMCLYVHVNLFCINIWLQG
jgi:hypothetical protein